MAALPAFKKFPPSLLSKASATPAAIAPWGLEPLRGRFVELTGASATAGLSCVAGLLAEAQRAGGLAVWLGDTRAAFFPPDLAAAGVDLAALAVIRLPGLPQVWQACDIVLRSGGFALVVVDTGGPLTLPFGAQTRLAGLAAHHHAALVVLTRETPRHPVRGSLVSLRAETEKQRAGHDRFAAQVRVVKDKRRLPGWTQEEVFGGTDGLY
jgi:recombination protein RecA